MAITKVTEKQIRGEFYLTLDNLSMAPYVEPLTWLNPRSDEETEEYAWLGQVPSMSEWGEGRNYVGLSEESVQIRNVHHEAGIEMPVSVIRRDKTSQAEVRIRELARRTVTHWNGLVMQTLLDNPTAYDGHYLISGSHRVSNTVAVSSVGSTSISSAEDAAAVIMGGIQQLLQMTDDGGEYLNESARNFVVITPVEIMGHVATAISDRGYGQDSENPLEGSGFSISMATSPRFSGSDMPNASDGGGLYVVRTDAQLKPMIRQQEEGTEPDLDVIGEGSELEQDDKVHHYGVDAWRGVGPGYFEFIAEAYASS